MYDRRGSKEKSVHLGCHAKRKKEQARTALALAKRWGEREVSQTLVKAEEKVVTRELRANREVLHFDKRWNFLKKAGVVNSLREKGKNQKIYKSSLFLTALQPREIVETWVTAT